MILDEDQPPSLFDTYVTHILDRNTECIHRRLLHLSGITGGQKNVLADSARFEFAYPVHEFAARIDEYGSIRYKSFQKTGDRRVMCTGEQYM